MAVAIILMILAFILYTSSVWVEHFVGFSIKVVFGFTIGFISDIIGTCIMVYNSNPATSNDFHTFIGTTSILIMFIHAFWATQVLRFNKGKLLFHTCSPYAWGLWIVAFGSGMYIHNAL